MEPKSPDVPEELRPYEPPRIDEAPELARRSRMLPCTLTADELVDRNAELVSKTKERELRDEGLRQWKAAKSEDQKVYEAEILHLATDCYRLARVIQSGQEDRQVEVVDVLLGGANVVTLRLDTGEVLSTRPAREDELQKQLPLIPL